MNGFMPPSAPSPSSAPKFVDASPSSVGAPSSARPARFTILGTLASGGMGTVYLARMGGSAGFARLVAIKRLHAELAAQRDFVTMLVDEARLASQIRHVNVIDTLDLVANDGAFSLVLEYVEGASLSALTELVASGAAPTGKTMPMPIALAIMNGVLRGLDAAHEARGAEGQPLGIIHRDVSPQNVLVGVDGIPRVIDFGIVKAMAKMTATRPGEIRGKLAYMAPEQLLERPATRQVDVYAAGVVLWELLTGRRLFSAEDQRVLCAAVLRGDIKPPSEVNPDLPRELDAVILKATARDVSDRYLTIRDLLDDLGPWKPASADEVGAWVREVAVAELLKTKTLLQNAAPEASRTADDLMRELAQSTMAMPQLAQQLPAPRPIHGTTSEGVEIVTHIPKEDNRPWFIALGISVLALFVVGVALIGIRGARASAASAAHAASVAAEASLKMSAEATGGIVEPTSAILPAPPLPTAITPISTPAASTSASGSAARPPASAPAASHHHPRKRPKRSPTHAPSDPLDHR